MVILVSSVVLSHQIIESEALKWPQKVETSPLDSPWPTFQINILGYLTLKVHSMSKTGLKPSGKCISKVKWL